MRATLLYWFVLVMLLALVLTNLGGAVESCTSQGPLLTGKDREPIWLNTDALLKSATHCVAPHMPAMMRQVRIEGVMLVDILVDEKGKVSCVQLINGHPLLESSAIDAAKDWTFRTKKQNGKNVSFYGHLHFYFSTGGATARENPCVVARW